MRSVLPSVVLMLCFCCVTAIWNPVLVYAQANQDQKDVLLDGLLARETLITTGTFVFKHTSMVIKDYGDGQPWPWEEGEEPYTMELTVAGEEWVVRWPGTPIVSMHRAEFSLTYTETPQPDGKETYRSLVITDPAGVHKSLEDECKGNRRYCILRAGSVPSAKLAGYLETNRNNIKHVGEKTINGIDTQILRIRLSKDELLDVFRALHPVYLEEDTMVMSFYVAPTRNYSAIRIEYATPDGYMTKRYECTEFSEVADRVFFPKCYCDISNFSKAGNGYYVHQYLISDIKNVNRPVPESSFEMEVPEGTRVRDSRPGKGEVVFYLDDKVSFSTADKLIQETIEPPKSKYLRIISVVSSATLLLLLIVLLTKRRLVKKR